MQPRHCPPRAANHVERPAAALAQSSIVNLPPLREEYNTNTEYYTTNAINTRQNETVSLRGRVSTIPRGTMLMIKLDQPVSSFSNRVGDQITATLENDIFVNDAITWNPGAGNPTTLTLNALRDVTINQAITATNGNLVVCCGQDININAAVTTVNGSVLLTAATLRLVEGFVDARPLGPQTVKGRAEPVDVYELKAVRPGRTRYRAVPAHAARPWLCQP